MRLGLKFSKDNLTRDNLVFAQQMGVTDIVLHGPRMGEEGVLDFLGLLRTRKFIESFGLNFLAIENLPGDHWSDIVRGRAGRD